jgi:hypothetical protein
VKIQVTWHGVDDSTWVLLGEKPARTGVILKKPNGLVAKTNETTRENSTGIGEQVIKRTYPPLEGELELAIHGADGGVWAEFIRSLSVHGEGTLIVSDSRADVWMLSARLAEDIEPPEFSPTGSVKVTQASIKLKSDAGLWRSPIRRYAADALITNGGDIPTFPVVEWQGSGKSVTLPSGQKVALPTVTGVRRLSTDPGTGFVVTTPTGEVDSVTWSKFRGLATPGEIAPGGAGRWKIPAGVTVETTDYVRSPWR